MSRKQVSDEVSSPAQEAGQAIIPGLVLPVMPQQMREINAQLEAHATVANYDRQSNAGRIRDAVMVTHAGCPAQLRDGWRGRVKYWRVSAYPGANPDSGEMAVLPSILFESSRGERCRLFNGPAIDSWYMLLASVDPAEFGGELPIVCRRRQSGTAGRSYWVVELDPGAGDGGER